MSLPPGHRAKVASRWQARNNQQGKSSQYFAEPWCCGEGICSDGSDGWLPVANRRADGALGLKMPCEIVRITSRSLEVPFGCGRLRHRLVAHGGASQQQAAQRSNGSADSAQGTWPAMIPSLPSPAAVFARVSKIPVALPSACPSLESHIPGLHFLPHSCPSLQPHPIPNPIAI